MSQAKPTATLQQDGKHATITLTGTWTDYADAPDWQTLAQSIPADATETVILLDGGIQDWNSALVAFTLNMTQRLKQRNLTCDCQKLPAGVPELIRLALAVPERPQLTQTVEPQSFLHEIGNRMVTLMNKTTAALDFVGLVAVTLGNFLRGKTRTKWKDILFQIARCGHQAIPIVSLMGFLIGVILAFIGSIPLKMFGADIYIATLIGIGVFRLMAATTVGTVMAGRTGAAFAAELGSMQANEEIDAYIAMGLSPVEILVLPRFIALSFALPLLCVYADCLGILGGLLVGVIYTDAGLHPLLQQLKETTAISHFFIGIVTSWIFGILIALCGCYHGLHCGRNSSAVGQAATAAVVSSIVCMVFATALITLTTVIIGL